ncbi:DUF4268 domain-containing protein [Paraflavitalea soli]|uniref:DUF4268 domain-containing protein n=1 Tax=Paraflavitalea soli TaxID=2315862 RepID=A0A3B7MJB3_9BACT|nr:DUF4268 domain-containing protein [Paraflavitalea soli]AXY73697.1 DUF4268 domain-containing protein [Paraflavitalea soli]
MYTREEVSKQKQAFWTAFGKYMQPVLSAEGQPVSWLNYKTGVGGIHFKMDADRDRAVIKIQLSNSNPTTRQLHYEQFQQLKTFLEATLGEDDWVWENAKQDEYGKTISSISKTLPGVNIHQQADWATIISFLKPRIIALDEFWGMVKPSFEMI